MRYENMLFKGGPCDGEHHLVRCDADRWLMPEYTEPALSNVRHHSLNKTYPLHIKYHWYTRNNGVMIHERDWQRMQDADHAKKYLGERNFIENALKTQKND